VVRIVLDGEPQQPVLGKLEVSIPEDEDKTDKLDIVFDE
jgi:hypothetical protein